ncbi:MAG: outer membrane protein assembly factor [Deltaproteobacteria bacterium]|nr:outer membrane protein assembly factor [Deltaproteobacteria bacterium]
MTPLLKTVGRRRDALCRSVLRVFFVAACLGWMPPCAHSEETLSSYDVRIEGLPSQGLLDQIKRISNSIILKDKPPASPSLLRKRVDEDVSLFTQWLRAQGYFGSHIGATLDETTKPLTVIFQVDTGPLFLLRSVDVQIAGRMEATIPDIGLTLGVPFNAETLAHSQNRLVREFTKKGFPFAEVTDRRITVDHADHSVAVVFFVTPGPSAQFGPTRISGLVSVEERVVHDTLPWTEGERFNADLIDAGQKKLISLGLFSLVRAFPAQELDESGRVPVNVILTERKHRSVSAGISYQTDEGPGVNASWENRNLFGGTEKLAFSATFADYVLSAEGGYLKPFFLRKDQSLRLSARLADDKPDAYSSRNLKSTSVLERSITEELKLGGGLGLKLSRVTQLGETNRYSYLLFPLNMEYDGSDDLLDPSRGNRVGLKLDPYADPFEDNPGFVRGFGRYRHYVQILKEPSLVLAGGIGAGAIVGADSAAIPADERFYAGGGGSIRGYAYQSVGPIKDGVPVGGNYLIELSFELRLKISDRIGVVGFLDGGNAFASPEPDFSQGLLWGTGVGLRYYSPVGPFRLDVGFPLDRRPGLDDRFQVYVSLGQAF